MNKPLILGGTSAYLWAGALLMMGGCAHAPLTSTGDRVQLQVPFYSQHSDQCGPESLASLLGYWNKPTDPDSLKKEIYTARLHGSLPMDLLIAARAHGLRAEINYGSLANIKEEIRNQHPVIAYLDMGIAFLTVGHFVIVTGYDTYGIYAHSANHRDEHMSYSQFERHWQKTGQWWLKSAPQEG